MKSRWLAITAVLASFSAGSWMLAQTQNPNQPPGQTTGQNPGPTQSPTPTAPTQDPDQNQPKAADVENAPKQAPAALPTQDDSQIKHDGTKTDVDAVGNRNVGCGRGVGNWYTVEGQVARGRVYAQQIESQIKLVNDPVVTEYVNRVGQNLVRNSDAQVPFTIKVIDSDVVNAMALPGGFFYVNSGLILASDEEAEMAGVMAHEIAHVCARHGTKQATKGEIAQLAMIPAMIFIPYTLAGYAIYQGMQFAIPMAFLQFTRTDEKEADYLGLEYMYKAGYDPNAFVAFFEKVASDEKKQPGTIPKIFSTHPPTPERIEASQKEIATILPQRSEYIVTTSEFDVVKHRLQLIKQNVKVNDKNPNKPTLRKKTAQTTAPQPGDTSTTSDPNSDPDRPTLQHRTDPNQQP